MTFYSALYLGCGKLGNEASSLSGSDPSESSRTRGQPGSNASDNTSSAKVRTPAFCLSFVTNSTLADLALAFSTRSGAHLSSTVLQKWHQVHSSHRNALAFAVHYNSAQLQFKMLLTWRLELRAKLKLVKQGRMAEKFFIYRRAWKMWVLKLEEKAREKKLRELERRKMMKYYLGMSHAVPFIAVYLYHVAAWSQRAKQEHQRREAEMLIQRKVALVSGLLAKALLTANTKTSAR